MKKRQQKSEIFGRGKKTSMLNWKKVLLYAFLLLVLVVGVLYASNPDLFANFQSFAKDNRTDCAHNIMGCGRKVREALMKFKGVTLNTPAPTPQQIEKSGNKDGIRKAGSCEYETEIDAGFYCTPKCYSLDPAQNQGMGSMGNKCRYDSVSKHYFSTGYFCPSSCK